MNGQGKPSKIIFQFLKKPVKRVSIALRNDAM